MLKYMCVAKNDRPGLRMLAKLKYRIFLVKFQGCIHLIIRKKTIQRIVAQKALK